MRLRLFWVCLFFFPLGFLPAQTNSSKDPGRIGEAPAEDSPSGSKWKDYLKQDRLFNDWFGYGKRGRDLGIDLNGSMTTDLLGNPVGGFSQGFAAASSLGLQLVLDFEKIASVPDTEFITSLIWRAGDNLSAERIGNLFTVAQLYGGQNLRLYEFMVRKRLFDDQLELKAGRMGAFDEFLSNPLHWNFVNNGFDGNPKGIFYDVPAFGGTVYPTSSWGMFAKWENAGTPWYVQAGAYLLDSDNGQNSTSGLNWTFDVDQGAAVFVQGGYRLNGKPNDAGLPGSYNAGAFFSGDNQPTFSTTPTSRSNAGCYFMLQQMLWGETGEANLARKRNVWGPGAMEGITVFSAIVVAPDESINQFPVSANNGLVWQGVIPGRPDDFAAFAVGWGGISDNLQNFQSSTGQPVQTEETVLEWTYRYYISNFFYIQPDLQYIIRPGATGQIDDALVLGAQISVTF